VIRLIKLHLALYSIIKNKKTYWILVFIISTISFSVRYANINSPQYVDEVAYLRLSHSLESGHLASQSSSWTVYNSTGATINWDNGVAIVEPWFDHPPLFAIFDIPFLILGSPRLLPIMIGALSTFLIMYLLRNKALESILAGSIFAGFPFAILLNSMIFIDNGSSFFLLLTIALTSTYEEKKLERMLILASISAGLSFLSKEMGIFAILYFLLYLLFSHSFKRHYKWLILSIGIASSWLILGLLLNSRLFLTVISTQFGRTNVVDNFQYIFTTAVSNFSYDFNNFYIGNVSPILFLSWIAIGSFAFGKGHKLIKLGLLSFMIILAVIRYAWFFTWIAVYPFFAIAIAYCIYEIISYAINMWKNFNK
jgi:4-amino-4-deoxy-L-arabinose transferase-like glycosyltransferase